MSMMDGVPQVEAVRGPGARQSAKDECDINRIMARYAKSGQISHVQTRTPVYLDVTYVSDYRDAVEQVRLTDRFFRKLPAKLRQRFDNDPATFLDFASDAANRPEMEELGLIPKEVVPDVVPAAEPVAP